MRLRILAIVAVFACSAAAAAASCQSLLVDVRLALISAPTGDDSGAGGVAWLPEGSLRNEGGAAPVPYDAYLDGVVDGQLLLEKQD
jgi:hypothetical protein